MEGKNLGRNQSYILDVAVETIEMKKRKSSTVHENSQPKVAKIPVMIKFVKKEAQVQSNIEESTDSLEKSVQNNDKTIKNIAIGIKDSIGGVSPK